VLIWLAILVYVLVINSKVKRAEQQLMLLEEALSRSGTLAWTANPLS